MDKKKPLKVLVTSIDASGHFNASLGISSLLQKSGHEVHFAHFEKNKSTIEKAGFNFIPLTDYSDKDYPINFGTIGNFGPLFGKLFEFAMKISPLEGIKEVIRTGDNQIVEGFSQMLVNAKGDNFAMLNLIEQLKPDVCVVDNVWSMPWMVKVSCPVIRIWSSSPNDLYNGPPMGMGLSVHDPPELWDEYRQLRKQSEETLILKIKEIFKFFNVDFIDQFYVRDMGMYIYPGPLDFHELGSPKKNWFRLESSIRIPESSDFEIPEKLKDKPGKLIYLSMGTVASVVLSMMQMIIDSLANSPHRFIVSTGPNGDAIKLHDNMWGDKYLNQIAILPKVDLFITHGGNNSTVEGLAAGKPLIVIPQFGDQLDNAQRVADLGLGVRVNLYKFSGDKLLNAIEYVLDNEEIHKNVLRISEELKNSDSSDEIISLIEKLVETKKSTQ